MFKPVQVIDKVQESQTIWSFYLKPADGDRLAHYLPGQHIIVRLQIPGQAGPVQRSYTLSGVPGQKLYRITVKREGTPDQPGIASSFLHDHVDIGDTIWISEPLGGFALQKDSRRPVVLLSAGVGITPMLGMLEAIAEEPDPRQVWFVHGSRNAGEQPMLAWLRSLARTQAHIRVSIHHSQPSPSEIIGVDYDALGRIDLDFLKQNSSPANSDFYICGPASFVKTLADGLRSLGIADSRLFCTYFSGNDNNVLPNQQTAPIFIEEDLAGAVPTISLTQSGRSFSWADGYGNLLNLLEKHDIYPPSSCREGTCMSCSTRMISGTVIYDPEPFGDPFEGEILLCCARPETDITLDL
ncbi:MAG: hypothetical protein BGO21_24760 [Dyadobacter sp. 50-39]|uniref:2Fe-2S iron-sulfur cluster-binding protein n=1 Tax=Dyadobacter sp. 50-39 TaxID=1895756 RepID=UPI000963CD3F|nr:2Fe-2S iron-sulfur cluster-binding protein [Dyadobacter sp. 50-39]OJV21784.1 MAG: hypothetical protein BGO21_24760 [Dyadobacter sp. 50-39]